MTLPSVSFFFFISLFSNCFHFFLMVFSLFLPFLCSFFFFFVRRMHKLSPLVGEQRKGLPSQLNCSCVGWMAKHGTLLFFLLTRLLAWVTPTTTLPLFFLVFALFRYIKEKNTERCTFSCSATWDNLKYPFRGVLFIFVSLFFSLLNRCQCHKSLLLPLLLLIVFHSALFFFPASSPEARLSNQSIF